MNKLIYITRPIPESGLKILRDNNIDFDMGTSKLSPSKKDLIKILKKKNYDGLVVFLTDIIDKDIMDASSSIKIIASFTVGYDNVDINEAKKRGIIVSNTQGSSSTPVAEHAVALIIALTTRICEGDRFMRARKYKGWDPNLLIGTDLKGKTLGLIGCGAIGTEVAHMLYDGFGLKIIYNDITVNKTLEENDKAERRELDDLLKESDIISLHVPLLPSTRHLINKEKLAIMKNSAYLINTSRGPVINENDLVYALKNKLIRGAGLDVFEYEPKLAKGLAKLENVILTPHIASARESSRNLMSVSTANNIVSYLINKIAINNCIK